MMKISCLLLAAGKSSRMEGKNKLMLEVDGSSLITRTYQEILKVKFDLEEIIVVTGHEEERVKNLLSPWKADFVYNERYATGMHSSIKAGLRALSKKCQAFFICLADQPYLDHGILKSLRESFESSVLNPDRIFIPLFQGQRGHPVLISSAFIPEILEEPDGDYGCSYLLKRHKDKVVEVPVPSPSILIDLDTPADYQRFLDNSLDRRDPVEEFFSQTIDLRRKNRPFAIATVIEVIGSASARTGSKAIFNGEGKNLIGWVGGGCAERFIGDECAAAIKEGRTRTVLADLDDEIFGLGVVCGGKMRVFIDPILPMETVALPFPVFEKFREEIRVLAGHYGWNVKTAANGDFQTPPTPIESVEDLLLTLARTIGRQRGTSLKSLREVRPVPAHFSQGRLPASSGEVTIVGRTRITEALARHFGLLGLKVKVVGPHVKQEDYPSSVKCQCLEESYDDLLFSEGEVVVVASHTAQDPLLVRKALQAGASYVGMIGSLKRSEEVLTHLDLLNKKTDRPLFIPAGLDIDARNPDEIALSVVSEVVSLMDLKEKRRNEQGPHQRSSS